MVVNGFMSLLQRTLSDDVMQLDTVINTTVMNVTRVVNTTNELIANITGQILNGFLNNVSIKELQFLPPTLMCTWIHSIYDVMVGLAPVVTVF